MQDTTDRVTANRPVIVRLSPNQRAAAERARIKTGQTLTEFIETAMAAECARSSEFFPLDARRLPRKAA